MRIALQLLVLKQKSQECLGDRNAIVMVPNPVQRIFRLLRVEDALLVAHRHQIAHNGLGKLGVALNRYETPFLVHALYKTPRRPAERLDAFWVFEDHITVHLVDALRNVSTGTSEGELNPTRVSCLKISLPFLVNSTGSTETSHPPSLRPTLTPAARPMIW